MRVDEVVIGSRVFLIIEQQRGFCGYDSEHILGDVIPAGTKPLTVRKTFDECREALKVRARMERLTDAGMSDTDAALKIIFG